MEHARFWSLIDEARGARGKISAALVRVLAALTPDEIAGFDAWMWAYYVALAREDLWAAIYAIRGGCGDDSFDYFRGWLISRGEAAVLSALRDPESLAAIVGDETPSDEHVIRAARAAYPGALPDHAQVEIPGRAEWPEDRFAPGLDWNAAFFARHYPALFARYVAPDQPAQPVDAITHARFWQIVGEARGDDIDAIKWSLLAVVGRLAREELIGFDRWMSAYNGALARDDVRRACRVVLGKDDGETAAGFRGWLIAQGEAAVHAAAHDLDAILEHAKQRPAPCRGILMIAWRLLDELGVHVDRSGGGWAETIPDRDTWQPDTTGTPTYTELRARFPRLAANRTDEQLGGPVNVSQLSPYEQQRYAVEMLERARALTDDAAKLATLDSAVTAWPEHEETRTFRGHVHARLGDTDAALADFDAVLARRPGAMLVRWARAMVRLARGDRDGAVADARAAADQVPEARQWLAAQITGIPKRVRHPKFGEGTVVAADTTGTEPTLVIDFGVGRKTIASRFIDVIE